MQNTLYAANAPVSREVTRVKLGAGASQTDSNESTRCSPEYPEAGKTSQLPEF